MNTSVPPPLVPDPDLLAEGMTAVFGEPVSVLERKPNWWCSTFPSEVITCRLSSGREQQFLCKYGSAGIVRAANGHRHGLGYELRVYERVLQPLDLPSSASDPRISGSSGNDWV